MSRGMNMLIEVVVVVRPLHLLLCCIDCSRFRLIRGDMFDKAYCRIVRSLDQLGFFHILHMITEGIVNSGTSLHPSCQMRGLLSPLEVPRMKENEQSSWSYHPQLLIVRHSWLVRPILTEIHSHYCVRSSRQHSSSVSGLLSFTVACYFFRVDGFLQSSVLLFDDGMGLDQLFTEAREVGDRVMTIY